MSIFICDHCDQQVDGDFDGCRESPYNGKEVCEECYHELKDTYGCHDNDQEQKNERPDWDMKNSDYL